MCVKTCSYKHCVCVCVCVCVSVCVLFIRVHKKFPGSLVPQQLMSAQWRSAGLHCGCHGSNLWPLLVSLRPHSLQTTFPFSLSPSLSQNSIEVTAVVEAIPLPLETVSAPVRMARLCMMCVCIPKLMAYMCVSTNFAIGCIYIYIRVCVALPNPGLVEPGLAGGLQGV